jgi:tetratricopeptide (TPR) repeat protein
MATGNYDITLSKWAPKLASGDKLAENGDCAGAMRQYERALDARPGGVEALTGLGYCHLDRKEYARAISTFRAALGISSRFTEALIGIAEAYRFQGMNGEAVTYYRRYLEQAPNGSRAEMARRQVEALAPPKPEPRPEPEPAAPGVPVERLPDRPGGSSAPSRPPPSVPSETLPDRPGGASVPEPEPEPPPPPPADRGADPAAPDSPGGQP